MNKLKAIFMLVLLSIGTFIQAGTAVAESTSNNSVPEEILSSKVILKDGDSSQVKPGEQKTVFENLVIQPEVTIPDTVYSIISLPKDKFLQPTENDLTRTDDNVEKAEILNEDANNYQVKYTYKNLHVGSEISIPLIVHLKDNMKPGTVYPVSDKTYSGDGEVMSNGGKLDLIYPDTLQKLVLPKKMDKINRSLVNENDELLNDYKMSGKVTTTGGGTIDPGTFVVTVTIPEPLEFDTSVKNSWTYDATTRTATLISKPNEEGYHGVDASLPIIIKKGSKVDVKYPIHGTLAYDTDTNNPFSTDDGYFGVTVPEEIPVEGEASKEAMVDANNDNNYSSYDNYTPTSKGIGLWSRLYPASGTENNIKPENQINSTVKSIEDTMDNSIEVDNDSFNQVDTINADYGVYTELFPTATGSKDTQEKLSHNRLTINYIDGTSEELVDINFRSTSSTTTYFNKEKKVVKSIKLVFDTPVTLTSQDGGYLCLNLQGSVSEDVLKQIRSNMKGQRFYFKDNLHVDYVSDNPEKSQVDVTAAAQVRKDIPNVSGAGLEYSSNKLLAGNTITAKSTFGIRNSEVLKDKNLKNGKIVYLLPDGVSLSKDGTTENMKNVQEIKNYRNTGYTAVIGDITNGDITKDDFITYSIPITANETLNRDSYNVKAMLVFDNDKSTYNMDEQKNEGYYIGTASDSKPNYGLYAGTDSPDGLCQVENSFQYEPAAKLAVTKKVSQKGTDNWLSDTGKVAAAPGEQYSYKLRIANYSLNNDFTNIDAVEILPYVNDKMITNGESTLPYRDRGSEFSMKLTGPIEKTPAKFTILYSTSAVSEAQGLDANIENSEWLTADEITDWSKVTMVRFKADEDYTLKRNQAVEFQLDVQTPAGIDYNTDLVSNNTFATRAIDTNGTLQSAIESNIASIRTIGEDPVIPTGQGAVKIIKQDVDDKTKNLAGAEFKLTDSEGKEYTGVTNDNGVLMIPNLPVGEYKLQETKAPEDYELDPTVHKVTVKDGEVTTVNVYDKKVIKQGAVKVIKQDADDKTKTLAGAEFKLTDSEGKEYTGVTDDKGVLIVPNLLVGEYQLQETKAPKGYELDSTIHKVIVRDGEVTTVNVYDKKVTEPDPDPSDPNTPELPPHNNGNNNSNKPNNNHKPDNSAKAKLPKTGDEVAMTAALSLVGIMLITSIVFVISKKKTN
ncbi:SpaA isopeptide-forming pilin-related protein [Lactobacillus sp. YT155]|uniref:SpaA isopeptide-forming pilin-related protein n=1 Tax=Lactobacillus sp. YT155 TaxID=3060955 RepID=UPI00265F1AA9|nr:SpaA isopeptide-forming pilin-related protein [Lactobacillus sp. YT155]MDO1605326.1 SpaA isopeptide-forming pilin-related protein [Lactobacillus sp. YT155]